jgi:hypothetical protein
MVAGILSDFGEAGADGVEVVDLQTHRESCLGSV